MPDKPETNAPKGANKIGGKCPVCGASSQPETRPFCSRGCANRDLLNWLDERYALPSKPVDPMEDEPDQTR